MYVILIPSISCNISHLCCYKGILLMAPWQNSKIRLHKYQILSMCSSHFFFLVKEWINLYVLHFLSAHEDEQGCPRSLKARVWSLGNENPWYYHQTKGSKSHLSFKASGEGILPTKNVPNSTFTPINSYSSSKYHFKHLLLFKKLILMWREIFGFSKSHSTE